jgi:hypothetical protein
MNKRAKFRDLRKFLEGLGFHYTRQPDCEVLNTRNRTRYISPKDLTVIQTTLTIAASSNATLSSKRW